jgi:hypothetical protein
MEATRSPEKSVAFQRTTQRYILEDKKYIIIIISGSGSGRSSSSNSSVLLLYATMKYKVLYQLDRKNLING